MHKLIGFFLCLLIFLSACRSSEGWFDVFQQKGREYFKKGKLEEARTEFIKAQWIFPARKDELHEDLFYVYYRMQNWDAALECLNGIIVTTKEQMDAELYFLRAELILRKNHDLLSALREGYSQAIRRDPTKALYYEKRAKIYKRLGEFDLVKQDLKKAQELRSI